MTIIRTVIVRLGISIIVWAMLYFGGTEVRVPTTPTPSAVCPLMVRRTSAPRGIAMRWPPASMFNL